MNRRLNHLIGVIVLLGVILAACAPAAPTEAPATEEPEAPEKLTIAWIPKALNNPVFEVGRDGAFKKAEELTAETGAEVEVLYVGSVASDMTEQARVVEDVIAKGVDAIGISCNDPTGCEDPINKAVDAGIPVMTWDSDSPDSKRFTYLGVDNYEGGKAAADLLVRFMGEEGEVALLTGVPGAFNLEERIRGFQDGVADYPGIEIVTTVYCNDDINLGVQVVEETMQANPDLDGWFFVGLWPLFAERGSMPLWEDASLNKGMANIVFDTLPLRPWPGGPEVLGLGLRHGPDDLRLHHGGQGVRRLDRLGDGHRDRVQRGRHGRDVGDQRLHQAAARCL